MLLKGKLTIENPETEEFEFQGKCAILLEGAGQAQIIRSVSGSDFMPMTDGSGDEVFFTGGNPSSVIFNGNLENSFRAVKFKIKAELETDVGEINYTITQGW